mgnify:CR=1 FL=1
MSPRVAVICSVKDEAAALDALLDSLLAQSRPPDEIVLCDGGSRDATVALIGRRIERGAPLRLIERPGSNIAAGRNAASTRPTQVRASRRRTAGLTGPSGT